MAAIAWAPWGSVPFCLRQDQSCQIEIILAMFWLMFSVALVRHSDRTPASVAGADDQPRRFCSVCPATGHDATTPRPPLAFEKRDPPSRTNKTTQTLSPFTTTPPSSLVTADSSAHRVRLNSPSPLTRDLQDSRSHPQSQKTLALIAPDKNPRRQAIVPSPRRRPGSRAASISASARQPAPSWPSSSPSPSSSCPVFRLRNKSLSSIPRHRFPASPNPLLF